MADIIVSTHQILKADTYLLYGLYILVVRVFDFIEEGMGFNPWPGHGDFTLGVGTLHIYPSSPRGTRGYQYLSGRYL